MYTFDEIVGIIRQRQDAQSPLLERMLEVKERYNGEYLIKVLLNERNNEPKILKDEILNSYNGSIIFKVVSNDRSYKFYYSLDDQNNFNFLTEIGSDKILSKGYTGAYCGLYSTTNGKNIKEYADFDWVILK